MAEETSIKTDFDTSPETAEVSDNEKQRRDDVLWKQFIFDIDRYEKRFKRWTEAGEKIIKNYKNERPSDGSEEVDRVTFNVLWSNVQTLKPTLYSRIPKVVAERRFKDYSPVGRVAAMIAERAGQFSVDIEKNRFNRVIDQVVEDRLLPGRGVPWVCYDFETQNLNVGEEEVEKVSWEEACTEYVYWKDFGHTDGNSWDDVQAVWKKAAMSKEAVKERFGDDIAQKLNYEVPDDVKKDYDGLDIPAQHKRAWVYERWDKKHQQVFWLSKGLKDEFLEVSEPLCHFLHFFPCPEPLYATLTAGSLEPTADFTLYRSLAEDLDYITKRKASLVEVCRLVGTHAADINEVMIKIKDLDDGDSLPIKQWIQFAERGGFKGVMQWFPIEEVSKVINELTKAQDDLLSKIYEVTGLSDIIRGNTSPSETATAQQIKGQWASLRVAKRQYDVQRLVADLVQMKCEIILEHFDEETIKEMVGFESFDPADQELFPQALALLRDDQLRTFKIDIQTDSTLAVDEAMDKEAANEYIAAIGNLFQQSFQMMQVRPELLPFMLELTKFGARRYRTGKTMEAALEKAIDAINAADQEAQNNPPPEQPDPTLMKAQAQVQAIGMKAQVDQQVAAKKMETEIALAEHKKSLDQWEAQQQFALKQQKMVGDQQIKADKAYGEIQAKYAAAPQRNQQETIAQVSQPPVTINIDAAGTKVQSGGLV